MERDAEFDLLRRVAGVGKWGHGSLAPQGSDDRTLSLWGREREGLRVCPQYLPKWMGG